MPQAVAAWAASAWSGATVGTFAGATAAGTVTAVSVGLSTALVYAGAYIVTAAAVGIGISQLASAVAGKKSLATGSLTSGSPLQMTRDSISYRRVIYGETRLSGPMLDAFISGTANEYLHLIVALAAHECYSIGDVYFTDEVETLDGSGNATGAHAGYARIKKHLGASGQTADSDFVSDSGGSRASSDKFTNICNLYGRFKWAQNIWVGGFPNLSAVVKGRLCYDPRTTSTGWTDNPALCIRDYLTNTKFGLAVDSADIDDDSFIAAANICDEAVTLAAGGTEARYRCNGSFELSAEPATVLQKLVESMAGALVYVGGKWILYAGAHPTPETSHLTEDDLSGQISVQTKMSLRDTCNRVRGTFTSPDEKWQSADVIPIVNGTYLAQDEDIEIWRDMNFGFVTSHSQAQRLMKIELERTRQDISFTAPCKLTALRYKPGDVVPVDNDEMGWDGKRFVVTGLKFSTSNVQGELALGVDLSMRETAAEVWDWNSGEETTYDPAANTNLHDPRIVPVPSGLTLALATLAERTALPRIKVTWTLPSDQFVQSGGFTEIEFKKNSESEWVPWNRVSGSIAIDYLNDVESGTNTDVRIRHINAYGVVGAWSSTASIVAAVGTGTYTALLTNEAHSISCDSGGTPISGELGSGGRAKTTILAFAGATALTAVASSPGAGQFSYSIATLSGTGTWTKESDSVARADSITTDSVVARITIDLEGLLTVSKDWTLTKINSGTDGDPGTNGDDATVYWLVPDAAAINKSIAGAYTPSTLNLAAYYKTGTGAPAVYAGRFIIATFNGSTWTDQYTSASDESSKAYTVPASILAIRTRLYLAGGTSALVDEQIVPIVFDGATGDKGDKGDKGDPGDPGADGADGGTYTLTIWWNGNPIYGGTVNGTHYAAVSSTITGLTAGSWVSIEADTVSPDTWSTWNEGSNTQIENLGDQATRILMGGNYTIYADYV